MKFQCSMGNQLTLIDQRTGGRVTLQVSPTMTLEELTRFLREQGVVRPEETVIYGKITGDGSFQPLTTGVVEDLLALQARGQRIGFMAQRVQGDTCVHSLRNVGSRLGFKVESDFIYGTFMWTGDNQQLYLVFVGCQRGETRPTIYICPYPWYVKIYPRFEDNHAKLCCWERRVGDDLCCFWHIDEVQFDDLLKLFKNDLTNVYISVLNSIFQILELIRVY
jgi:hypothetical protein